MSLLDDAKQIVTERGHEDDRDPRIVEIERIARELHMEGLDFSVEHGQFVRASLPSEINHEVAIPFEGEHLRIALVSDTHGGSKFEQLTSLRAFYRMADEEEVDFFIHTGDITQGPDQMHRGMEHEVHAHGADAQVDYVVQTFPRSERGVPTYLLGGNHDESFLKQAGVNVARAIANRRPDFRYVGMRAAYLTIGPLRAYLLHPMDGPSYAKSYKPQKFADALPTEREVNLMAIGHYHVWGAFKVRRTHAYMVPCFQGPYSWLASKGLVPDIGGVLVDISFDGVGHVRRIRHELIDFPVVEEDYDREVSAQVSRAWTPEGLRDDPRH